MKSILYVGATLMIGASVYGFVDYKQTQNKKGFKEMYVEQTETVPPFAIPEEKTTAPVVKKSLPSEELGINSNNKRVVAKKQAVVEDEPFIAIKPIAEDEMITTKELKEIETSSVNIKTAKDSGVEKKVIKKRKLSTKLFSRGALDERYIEPKVKKDIPKEEIKKTEDKEQ